MRGFTKKLEKADDLLKKLEFDLKRLENSPSDAYAAFDFFVTAEHIPDWIKNIAIKKENELLMVVSHIANGAKHFEVSDSRHKSVTNIEIREYPWPDESGKPGQHIFISFNLQDGAVSGLELSALLMARQVYQFWKDNFDNIANIPIKTDP